MKMGVLKSNKNGITNGELFLKFICLDNTYHILKLSGCFLKIATYS